MYSGPNQIVLEEYHRWVESLDKNATRVIKTNLALLLPQAVIESDSWDSSFRPDVHLKITVSEFKIDNQGRSTLRATAYVLTNGRVLKKQFFTYQTHVSPVTIDNLVRSMSQNLNALTVDIARVLRQTRVTKDNEKKRA